MLPAWLFSHYKEIVQCSRLVYLLGSQCGPRDAKCEPQGLSVKCSILSCIRNMVNANLCTAVRTGPPKSSQHSDLINYSGPYLEQHIG